jgi:hypothetical protein
MITPVRSRTAAAGRALDVAELARRQLVVDDDDGGTRLPGGRGRRVEVRPLGLVLVVFGRLLLAGGPLGTTPVPPVQAASSTSLPSPSSVAAPRPWRFCVTSPTTSKPRVSHRRLSSFSEACCSASVTPLELHADEHGLGARGFGEG